MLVSSAVTIRRAHELLCCIYSHYEGEAENQAQIKGEVFKNPIGGGDYTEIAHSGQCVMAGR